MNTPGIRIYFQQRDGRLVDGDQSFGPEDFAGLIPSVGDEILEPGVLDGLDRTDARNRRLFRVTRRVFNPRDNPDHVVLIVQEATVTERDTALVPFG